MLKLLQESKLTGYEEELLKVLLSKTVNLLDESCYDDILGVLGAEILARNFDMLSAGLDPYSLTSIA